MRATTRSPLGWPLALACRFLAVLALACALPAFAQEPTPVSPGAATGVAVAEARCPTFSWAGVPGAAGYEVAIFHVPRSEDATAADPVLVSRASLPAHATTWTPPVGRCLKRGERYAWSVAVAGSSEEIEWAPAFHFEVEPAPSRDEVEHALATLERHLEGRPSGMVTAPLLASGEQPRARRVAGQPRADANAADRLVRARSAPGAEGALPDSLAAPTSGVTRTASEANTPALGNPSLRISANLALDAASNVFKNGVVFLWDDADGNTVLGRNALSAVTMGAEKNTALGWEALKKTTGAGGSFGSSYNTAVGWRAMYDNASGYDNTAIGNQALASNIAGEGNTAVGFGALFVNAYGSRNTALGESAGQDTTGDDNILINSVGAPGESNVLRIGSGLGMGDRQLNQAFIHGIHGKTVSSGSTVLINAVGQLGTVVSSRRLKQDIEDVGQLADRLLDLRPVAFRFKELVAEDSETPREFGLIAEEVAEVFPELVIYDDRGQPQTVKYHLLSSLLLGEVQRQDRRAAGLEAELERVTRRLAALESRAQRTVRRRG